MHSHSIPAILQISHDLVALQMSRGPLKGRLRIFHLGAIRFNLLETSQSLFLSGTRRPKPCTLAIPLDDPAAESPYRAQGIPVPWPALMGYNRQLTDFDLWIPAGARLATIVIGAQPDVFCLVVDVVRQPLQTTLPITIIRCDELCLHGSNLNLLSAPNGQRWPPTIKRGTLRGR